MLKCFFNKIYPKHLSIFNHCTILKEIVSTLTFNKWIIKYLGGHQRVFACKICGFFAVNTLGK